MGLKIEILFSVLHEARRRVHVKIYAGDCMHLLNQFWTWTCGLSVLLLPPVFFRIAGDECHWLLRLLRIIQHLEPQNYVSIPLIIVFFCIFEAGWNAKENALLSALIKFQNLW